MKKKTKQAIVLNCPNQSLRLINKMVNAFSMFFQLFSSLLISELQNALDMADLFKLKNDRK